MDDNTTEARNACIRRCEAEFIKFATYKPVGGIEALRICRESCYAEEKQGQ